METTVSDKRYLQSGKHRFRRNGGRCRPASRRSRLVNWRAKPGKLSRCCSMRRGSSVACSSPSLAPHSAQRHPNLHHHPLPMTNYHPRRLISSFLLWIGPSLNVSPLNLPSRANIFRGLTQPKTRVPHNRARIGKKPHRNRLSLPLSYIRLQTPAAQRHPGSGRRRRTKSKTTTSFGCCSRFVPTLILRGSTGTSSRLMHGKLPHA